MERLTLDHPIEDELTVLGPVGWWRWKYRVVIRDVGCSDSPAEFDVSLQEKNAGRWHSVGAFGDRESVILYQEGRERDGTINDRTQPSEDEEERMSDPLQLFGFAPLLSEK